MSIRAGALEDLDGIVQGNRDLARETESLELDAHAVRRGVRQALEQGYARYWIAERTGAPVGQAAVTYEWSDWRGQWVWWIQSVYVQPEHRGSGVFSALYQRIVADAKAAGAAGVRLYVERRNTAARQVYAHLGMNGDHYDTFEVLFDAVDGSRH